MLVTIGPHPPPPTASSTPPLKPTTSMPRCSRLNSGELAYCARKNQNAHQSEIDHDEGRDHLAVHIGEQGRAENAADRPRDGDAPDDGPVDIAMPPVRCAGCCRRENFGDMMALACAGAVPKLSMTVVAVTPNAMPSAPSTSWASNPTKKKSNQDSSTRRPCNSSPVPITTGSVEIGRLPPLCSAIGGADEGLDGIRICW